MEKTRIFISYRRDESTVYAGWIYDRLAREFGKEQVFLDHTIEPGDDFAHVLIERVKSCDVLLAVIGKSWLSLMDRAGRLRLHNPEDYVAIEIGEALRRGVRVIPLLVGGSRMPLPSELPETLLPLARRQAYVLPDTRFGDEVEKLFPVLRSSARAAVHEKPVTALPKALTPVSVSPLDVRPGARIVNPNDGLSYIWIAPGIFRMGCSRGDTECYQTESPSHIVEITSGFWMGETPVTQEAYERVIGWNPSAFKGPTLPVHSVSLQQAKKYCTSVGARLPTEEEWEYAARAGSEASRYDDLDSIAWYDRNSHGRPHSVRTKQANAWGLYDMLGNIWEWVDAVGLARGGSYGNPARNIRVSDRNKCEELDLMLDVDRRDRIGFRCAGDWG
jgi:hypothetical protein